MRYRHTRVATSGKPYPELLSPVLAHTGALLLAAWVFWERLSFLGQSPYPVGVDGYYYATQLRHLLDSGTPLWGAAPVGFYVLAPFAAGFGLFAGTKIGAAAAAAALVCAAHVVGARIGGDRVCGWLVAAATATSPSVFLLGAEFLKSLVGLVFVVAAVPLWERWRESGDRLPLASAGLAMALAAASHKLAALLALLVVLPTIAFRCRARSRLRWRSVVGVSVFLVGAVLVLGVIYPQAFPSVRDAALFRSAWTGDPAWSLPAISIGNRALYLGGDPWIAAACAVAVVIALLLGRRRLFERLPPFVVPVCAAVLFCVLPWLDVADEEGIGFRLRGFVIVPGLLLLPALFRVGAERWGRRVTWAALTGAIALVCCRSAAVPEAVVFTHPALVSSVEALGPQLPKKGAVVTEDRHLRYLTAWYLERETARTREELTSTDSRWHLIPAPYATPELRAFLAQPRPGSAAPIYLHPDEPGGLVALPAQLWDELTASR